MDSTICVNVYTKTVLPIKSTQKKNASIGTHLEKFTNFYILLDCQLPKFGKVLYT